MNKSRSDPTSYLHRGHRVDHRRRRGSVVRAYCGPAIHTMQYNRHIDRQLRV